MNISIDLSGVWYGKLVAVTFSMRGESFVQAMTLSAALELVRSQVMS